jgi:CRISPR system Cascade subunit CasD
MTVVALRLAGPLQSWGSGSRFLRRSSEREPTKSGVLGLVAAAKGLRRTDSLEEILGLRFGVRLDQPGRLIRDFQTAQRPHTNRDGTVSWTSMPLSRRYYLSDAVYVAVLEGEQALVEGIDAALRSPQFPLYLGRRSCPPAGPVALGLWDGNLDQALRDIPWQASTRVQRRHRQRTVRLATVCDAAVNPTEAESSGVESSGAELLRDVPVSFDPSHRQYGWRSIIRDVVELPNPYGVVEAATEHDPMSSLGG